jgi:hypothetical protein
VPLIVFGPHISGEYLSSSEWPDERLTRRSFMRNYQGGNGRLLDLKYFTLLYMYFSTSSLTSSHAYKVIPTHACARAYFHAFTCVFLNFAFDWVCVLVIIMKIENK